MAPDDKETFISNFRSFFLRGLAILLPSILTIGILIWAYNLVQTRIAGPINRGVKELILVSTGYPRVSTEEVAEHEETVRADPDKRKQWQAAKDGPAWLEIDRRRTVLYQHWQKLAFPLDLIGLVIAVVLIYIVGAFVGSFIGRRLYHRGEQLLGKVPLIRQVYPSIKQVTDFLVGGGSADQKDKFSKVVAVEYPRKGLWSVGLVTGETMRDIEQTAGAGCLTVFVPSSPTPFTGYVITVPKEDTIELPITIEQALRFTISGGVLIPPSQVIGAPAAESPAQAG